jgi:hypothetical protein
LPQLQLGFDKLYQSNVEYCYDACKKKIRDRDYKNVDWENLVEEMQDMGKSERRSLESNLIVVLLHLLKWQYQSNCRSGSWESSIIEHRRRIKKALQESPSLKPYLIGILTECYAESLKQAKAETGLPLSTFPTECSYDLFAEIMNDEFLPL